VNALVTEIDVPKNQDGKYIINYSNFEGNTKESMEVDYIIGADGANSRVAKV
jgi:geranylgeranyl reductase